LALNNRQSKFVVEYIKDLNATQAAIRAGYSKKTASAIGKENLQKPQIAEAIEDQLDAQQSRTLITADRILREYARLGFMDTRKLFKEDGSLKRIVDLGIDEQAAITGIDVVTVGNGELGVGEITKIKLADRKGALDSMARCLMMFNDKKTISADEPMAQLLALIVGAKTDVLSRVRDDGDGSE
jgi:phage terminase small subunit